MQVISGRSWDEVVVLAGQELQGARHRTEWSEAEREEQFSVRRVARGDYLGVWRPDDARVKLLFGNMVNEKLFNVFLCFAQTWPPIDSILSSFVHVLSHEVLRSEELFQVVQNLISYKKLKKNQPSGHTCVLLSYVGQMMLTWSYSMRLDLVRPLLTSMTLSVLSILNLQKMKKMWS